MIQAAAGEKIAARRGGPARSRRCVVTRAGAPRRGLIRFVAAPDGTVVPDLAETLPGRGVWVTADRAKVDTAATRNLFGRGLGRAARAPSDLAERVARLLAERCIGLIGFARRSGALVVGRERIAAAIAAGEVALVLMASDRALRMTRPEGPAAAAVLRAAELGAALDRAEVHELGLRPGRLAEALTRETGRLAGFRAPDTGAASGGRGG